jgi:hypothetical protein
MRAAIFLPTIFVVLVADRTFLTVTDGGKPLRRNADLRQKLVGCFGAAVA